LRRISKEAGEYTGLVWSPDESKFAFTRAGRVFVMHADGSGTTELTTSGPSFFAPSWSPDGRRIAYGRGFDGGIGVVNADGTGEAILVPGVSAGDVAWSPDGRALAFSSAEFRIAVAHIATGSVRTVDTGAGLGSDYQPDWQSLP
jgi:Tol biopolymer transport system component